AGGVAGDCGTCALAGTGETRPAATVVPATPTPNRKSRRATVSSVMDVSPWHRWQLAMPLVDANGSVFPDGSEELRRCGAAARDLPPIRTNEGCDDLRDCCQ